MRMDSTPLRLRLLLRRPRRHPPLRLQQLPLGHFPNASADLICRVFTHGRSKMAIWLRELVRRGHETLYFYVFSLPRMAKILDFVVNLRGNV